MFSTNLYNSSNCIKSLYTAISIQDMDNGLTGMQVYTKVGTRVMRPS